MSEFKELGFFVPGDRSMESEMKKRLEEERESWEGWLVYWRLNRPSSVRKWGTRKHSRDGSNR